MSWTRSIIYTGLLVLFVHSVTQAVGEEEKGKAQKSPHFTTKFINLKHANAYGVAASLSKLDMGKAVAVSEDKLLLRGWEESVQEIVDVIIPQIDREPAGSEKTAVEMLPLGSISTGVLSPLLGVIAGDEAEYAIDPVNRMLVVRGTHEEIETVRALLTQLSTPATPLALHFTFLRGRIGSGSNTNPSGVPPKLMPIADTLKKNGLTDVTVLAPILVRASVGEDFQSSSVLPPPSENDDNNQSLEFTLSGNVDFDKHASVVHLKLDASATGRISRSLSGNLFIMKTSLTLPLEQYILLTTAPAPLKEGNAIILVVRVTME